jgi:hypothetical protein
MAEQTIYLCICGECTAVSAHYSIAQVESSLEHVCNACEEGAVEFVGTIQVTQGPDVERLAQH